MQLNLTISEIQGLATNGKVYSEGKAYAGNQSVSRLRFDLEDRCLFAKVQSMDRVTEYDVKIWLNLRERPRKVSCSCSASKQFIGCCKHQVAVMLHAMNLRLDHLSSTQDTLIDYVNTPAGGHLPTAFGAKDSAADRKTATGPGSKPSSDTGQGLTADRKEAGTLSGADTAGRQPLHRHRQTLEMMRRLQSVLAIDRGRSYQPNRFAIEDDPDAAAGDRPRRGILRRLDLRITLELPQYSSEMATLEARIGFEGDGRYYKVKSFEELIDAIDNGKSLVFGKELTFHPDRQYFNSASQRVIDWLIFQFHNQVEKTAFQYQPISSLFRKGQVVLNAARLHRFIELYSNEAADLDLTIQPYQGQAISPVVRREWPEVFFCLRSTPEADRQGSENRLTTAAKLTQEKEIIRLNHSAPGQNLDVLELILLAEKQVDDLEGAETSDISREIPQEDKAYRSVRAYTASLYKRGGRETQLRLLTHDASLMLYDGQLWVPPAEDRIVSALFRSLAQAENSRLFLGAEEAGIFMSQMLPLLESSRRILLAKEVKTALLREPLQASIWLDKEGNGLSARLEFRYGSYVVDPHPASPSQSLYQPEADTDQEEADGQQFRWQLRDENAELEILDHLQLSGFQDHQPSRMKAAGRSQLLVQASANRTQTTSKAASAAVKKQPGNNSPERPEQEKPRQFYLFGDKKLYTFLSLILPRLQDLATIYYSDRFMKLRIRRLESVKMKAGLRPAGDLLTIELDNLKYSPEDLARILTAYREKRRYVRLKDGEFLSLDPEHEDPTLSLLAEADSWGGKWEDQTLVLPKYRAVPLQQLLKQEQSADIELDEDLDTLAENLEDPAKLRFDLPASLVANLRPYQVSGFQWFCLMDYYGFGGILADDMGLGKTLQSLTYILHKKEERIAAGLPARPTLVVAPTSLIYNWQDEAQKFTPGLRVKVIEGAKENRKQTIAEIETTDLAILSYTVMRQDIELLEKTAFSACFLDEAQYIKNPRTLTAKGVKKLRADRRFALTGTPIENSLSELWSIFDFLMPGYLFSLQKFHQNFEARIARGDEFSAEASEALRQFVKPFLLRRMKKQVLTELPDKIESILRCDLTDEQQKLYAAYVAQARNSFEDMLEHQGLERSQIQILALLTRLRQIACHPQLFLQDYVGGSGKLDALEEHLENLLSSSHRILLFSQFTSMLDIIRKQQTAAGRKIFYIDGQVPARERLEQVDRFNSGEGELFLISLKAGGTGLNLTGADTVIHYDPWWNPAVEQQATDRAHRIGQREVVQIFRMVSRGTIEEKIIELQDQKSHLVDQVIQAGDNFLKQMDLGEIRSLLSYEL